jgi:hypothetical protein
MAARSIARKRALVLASFAAVMLLFAIPPVSAQSFCSSVIPSGSNYGSFGNLVSVSLLIILLMAFISSIVLMLGIGFKIPKLVSFGRKEFGEIGLTLLIIFVLLGSFAGISSTFAPASPLTNIGINYGNAIFLNDCNILYSTGIDVLYNTISLAVVQDMYQLGSSFRVVAMPLGLGVSDKPFAGLLTASSPVSNILTFLGGITGVTIGIAALLGVLYAIMPLFLFFGIILRTMPWTRAAGGAMLGFFIAFFIFFPTLMGFLLNSIPQAQPPPTYVALGSSITNIGIAAFTSLNPLITIEYLIKTLATQLYIILVIAMSFILAFDFGDSMGDLLGAPSLGTGDSLKKVL